MNKAIWSVVGKMIGYLLGLIPINLAKDAIDALIDKVEKAVQGKPYEAEAMQACTVLRAVISVPDEPGEDQSNPI